MDVTAVYVKTELGQEEITSRVRRVPARTRALLIMVDGRRSANELLANSPAPAEAEAHLTTLLEGGFIAAVTAPSPPPAPAAPAAPSSAPVQSPSAGLGGREFSPAELKNVKQVVSATLIEAIGPDADFFTGRVDDAGSKADLFRETERLRKMVNDSVGGRRAQQFWEKVEPLFA